jgi:hypothetical protein
MIGVFYLSFSSRKYSGNNLQQGRFSAAIRSGNGHWLVALESIIKTPENPVFIELTAQIFNLNLHDENN